MHMQTHTPPHAVTRRHTPSHAAQTDALVETSYGVVRNLVLSFANDGIDQSGPLARRLRDRFTDEVSGLGGRLEYKRLEGTHTTPNTPALAGALRQIDWSVADALGVGEAARSLLDAASRAEEEQGAACEAIADFLEREARLADAA